MQLIGFDFVFGIVELLRTLVFAMLSGSDDELSLDASVYVYFRFHFQKNPQWKCHSQNHWLIWK